MDRRVKIRSAASTSISMSVQATSATSAATSKTLLSAFTLSSENMPRNGSTNGSVTPRIRPTMSLLWLATSRSRMIRRMMSACRMPKAKVMMRMPVTVPPGPAGV